MLVLNSVLAVTLSFFLDVVIIVMTTLVSGVLPLFSLVGLFGPSWGDIWGLLGRRGRF